jgi:mono/diheme cytochrome c family protein
MNLKKSFRSLPHVAVNAGVILLFSVVLLLRPAFAQQAAFEQDKTKIAAGEDVYNTNCAICHGDQLVNSGQTFDLRRLKSDERPRFENSVRNGKNQMPPWKGVLSDEQIDQLWHCIRANAYQK